MKDEVRIRKTNRDKRKEPKRGKYWCAFCDGALVPDDVKCPNCGKKYKTGRHKKT